MKNLKHIKLFEQFILNENFYEYTKEIGDKIKLKFDFKKTHTDNLMMIVPKDKSDNTIIGHISSSILKDDSENYPISKKNPLYGKSIIWSDDEELNKILVDSGTLFSKGYNS